MELLLVEDTTRLATAIARGLREEGHVVTIAATGAAALARLARRDIDLAILDLGLPDLDGMEVLARVRADGNPVPILVLTARDALTARVAALDAGADDYLIKPFAFDELLARVRALARRAAAPRWAPLACGRVVIASDDGRVEVAGKAVALSPREHALLVAFLRRRGETLGRPELLREVFGYDFDPGTNVVDVHVAHLRRKLVGGGAAITTVRGQGYRLDEDPDA
ncbi:MAG: response regulator transcription factor [Deltaproteobacteria bacterium]|nr:response regulator transcription factor [Deltaproteobacteria bacterium]